MDNLFIDENDCPEYIGASAMGVLKRVRTGREQVQVSKRRGDEVHVERVPVEG